MNKKFMRHSLGNERFFPSLNPTTIFGEKMLFLIISLTLGFVARHSDNTWSEEDCGKDLQHRIMQFRDLYISFSITESLLSWRAESKVNDFIFKSITGHILIWLIL